MVDTAAAALTDSGGIQEETTYLGIPCVTMRENTERPITVEVGTNVLAGTRPEDVNRHLDAVLRGGSAKKRIPDLWDGHAAVRIVALLREELASL